MQGSNTAYRGGPLDQSFFAAESGPVPAPTAAPSSIGGDSYSTRVYSTTNIQVTGVDEADIVKTDGEYIYVASNDYMSNQNHVFILKAEAGDPRVIAKITLENNTYLAGMFLSQDSSKLVVIGSQYQMFAYDVVRSDLAMIYPYYSDVKTFITVYDVSDKVHPVLARNLTLSGSYFNSRMIGNYVYAVVSQSAYVLENAVTLPKVYTDEGVSDVPADTIYYADTMPGSFMFTSFVGFNVLDSSEKLANMTILMGGASTMYVSLDNIYVTYQNYGEQGDYTSIHRIHFDKNVLTPAAEGNVPGYVLNQYSMDENGNYFRLATTSQSDTTHNNVYVLNMNMTIVGKVEGLAKEERIYSARFMGDKAYIVTFRQIDPFFIIDLSDPFNPKVAGQLKIPGYSSYLHPFDENHVIGLGMENSTVKLSLFDVTNVNAPTEIAKYNVEGDYTYSDALYEPKAFLFDKAKELLVIPISITQYGVVDSTNKEVFVNGGFWQGAYVFKVNTGGFALRGGISHGENTTNPYYYGYNYNEQVTRALYIDNILYTISNNEVKLNSLSDLGQIAEVILR
jgi:uncharacterized secreted protein with C-terminal beta-propeller domain